MIPPSLTMVLYVFPAATLLTLPVPQQKKPAVFALGGLCCVWLSGGFPALILMMCMMISAWLFLRLQPVQSGTPAQDRNARYRMYAGIAVQGIWLLLGKLLLSDSVLLIPLLICAMQHTEAICDRAHRRISAPGLFPFFCDSAEMPRLFAGPPMQTESSAAMRENRNLSAENIGNGASLYIRGLFQVSCLSLPMRSLCRTLNELVPEKTVLDEWLVLISFYLAVYFGLKGAAQIGQGIAQMTGLIYPDSFDSPVLAGTHYGFWTRFMKPFSDWIKRCLFPERSEKQSGYLTKLLLVFCTLGFLFGSGVCGILWGMFCALVLTAERQLNPKWIAQIPVAARRVLVAVVTLFALGMLCSGSPQEMFTHYSGLFGKNGLAPGSRTVYLFKNYWFSVLLCTAALFPVRNALKKYTDQNKRRRAAARILKVIPEFLMLALSMAELMSFYLRG